MLLFFICIGVASEKCRFTSLSEKSSKTNALGTNVILINMSNCVKEIFISVIKVIMKREN